MGLGTYEKIETKEEGGSPTYGQDTEPDLGMSLQLPPYNSTDTRNLESRWPKTHWSSLFYIILQVYAFMYFGKADYDEKGFLW